MVKLVEIIIFLGLLMASFFAGVKYSDNVRDASEWLFEEKEKEIEIEDIEDDIIENKITDIENSPSKNPNNDLLENNIDEEDAENTYQENDISNDLPNENTSKNHENLPEGEAEIPETSSEVKEAEIPQMREIKN
jgi:hypothetical protein